MKNKKLKKLLLLGTASMLTASAGFSVVKADPYKVLPEKKIVKNVSATTDPGSFFVEGSDLQLLDHGGSHYPDVSCWIGAGNGAADRDKDAFYAKVKIGDDVRQNAERFLDRGLAGVSELTIVVRQPGDDVTSNLFAKPSGASPEITARVFGSSFTDVKPVLKITDLGVKGGTISYSVLSFTESPGQLVLFVYPTIAGWASFMNGVNAGAEATNVLIGMFNEGHLSSQILGDILGCSVTNLYRLYAKDKDTHMLTINRIEVDKAAKDLDYKYEQLAFPAYPTQMPGTVKVCRFYDLRNDKDKNYKGTPWLYRPESEAASFRSDKDYREEGIFFVAQGGSGTKITHLGNKLQEEVQKKKGITVYDEMWTVNQNEIDQAKRNGWEEMDNYGFVAR
ncbi:MAG: hypothetical protein LBI41_05755 [Lactobacillales bacterium]|nr:hypothetical protein [Lactobacillales bacterium]